MQHERTHTHINYARPHSLLFLLTPPDTQREAHRCSGVGVRKSPVLLGFLHVQCISCFTKQRIAMKRCHTTVHACQRNGVIQLCVHVNETEAL